MSYNKLLGLSSIAIVLGAGAVKSQANTLSFSASVPSALTNFNTTVGIQQFNPALGTLNSIQFIVAGHVAGDIKLESLDTSASIVTAHLKAAVKVSDPSTSFFVVASPSHDETNIHFTAWDGNTDHGGTSGVSFLGVSGDMTQSGTLTNSSLFLPFIGPGSVLLPVMATGQSSATGSGNLDTIFSARAAADVTVIYDFTTNGTPLPSTAVSGLVLLAAGAMTRRRRTA